MANMFKAILSINSLFRIKLRDPALRGALFKVCSCLCFSAINGFVRYLAITAKETGGIPLPAPEIAFFEATFGLLFMLPWVLSSGKAAFQTKNSLLLNLARAIASSMGIVLWFIGLSKLPIVQVVAFKYTAPLFIAIGAKIFLGEKCGWARALAIGTALSGALLISGAEFFGGNIHWTEIGLIALFPLGASACLVTCSILAKKQVQKDTPQTVCLYLLLFSIPILGIASSFHWVPPLPWQWSYLVIMGGFLAGAFIFLQNAYVIADITYLVPMSFTRLIAGAILGMLFFNEWPTGWTFLGSFFILVATVSLCKHEIKNMRTKERGNPLPAAA
jgi:drug/metabolite transporter (DMT)-like permease